MPRVTRRGRYARMQSYTNFRFLPVQTEPPKSRQPCDFCLRLRGLHPTPIGNLCLGCRIEFGDLIQMAEDDATSSGVGGPT